MKVVFLEINSKYSHTMLAPRYLSANSSIPVEIYQTNVNVSVHTVLADVFKLKPDVIACSVYIFNAIFCARVLSDLKKLLPTSKIIVGGWEAATNPQDYPFADYILKGEGDFAFGKLLEDIERGVIRERIIDCGRVENLNAIASPYSSEYVSLGKQKILYMETSRGCPFSCGYCMSGSSPSVRSFELKRVFEDIKKVMTGSPKTVKFVDRTFNWDRSRAAEIFNFLVDNYADVNTVFHFEMSPELFDENIFSALNRTKNPIFQFEIGVQSYNEATLKEIRRRFNAPLCESNIFRLRQIPSVTLHLDLIAGLPKEDISSFISGFNRLMSFKPHNLQLGFLKILNGSYMAERKGEFEFSLFPPYEVFSSDSMSFEDICRLKEVEQALEEYYNSEKFKSSIDFLLDEITPFELFEKIALRKRQCGNVPLSYNGKCDLLFSVARDIFDENPEKIRHTELLIERDFEDGGNCRKWRKIN